MLPVVTIHAHTTERADGESKVQQVGWGRILPVLVVQLCTSSLFVCVLVGGCQVLSINKTNKEQLTWNEHHAYNIAKFSNRSTDLCI
jgi:hypothetical protein